MRVLLIDHYDSFTLNLEHLIVSTLDAEVVIIPHDRNAEPWEVEAAGFDLTVLSPGPGHPDEYGSNGAYDALLRSGRPVFGVCMGMQLINSSFGGRTDRLSGCVHGKSETITWRERSYTVARYHSLYLAEVAPELDVLAVNGDGVPMIIQHKTLPVRGCQFHPESFLTQNGEQFVRFAVEDI
ncbi:MAG: anthranilate synthase component II [Desulfovibrio sp.]